MQVKKRNIIQNIRGSKDVDMYSIQLTRYIECFDGRKGCIFYSNRFNGLVLVDSPWRKDDPIGLSDNLHVTEENRISEHQQEFVLSQGYPAYLFLQKQLSEKELSGSVFEDSFRKKNDVHDIDSVLNDWILTVRNWNTLLTIDGLMYSLDIERTIKDVCWPKFEVNIDSIFTSYPAFTIKIGKEVNLWVNSYLFYEAQYCPKTLFPQLRCVDEADEDGDLIMMGAGFSAILLKWAMIEAYNANINNINIHDIDQLLRVQSGRQRMDDIYWHELSFDYTSKIDITLLAEEYIKRVHQIVETEYRCKPERYNSVSTARNLNTTVLKEEKQNILVFLNFVKKNPLPLNTLHKYEKWLEFYIQYYKAHYPIEEEPTRNIDDTLSYDQEANVEKKKQTQSTPKNKRFEILIDVKAPKDILQVLHTMIDGKGGRDVALILGAAYYQYHYLTRLPKEPEFTDEFKNVTTGWRTIKNHLNTYGDNPNNPFKKDMEMIQI